jgi:hypothetical protein
MKRNTVDTPYKNSWADQEFQRTHKPITDINHQTGRQIIVGYEKIHLPLHPDFGKRPKMPGEENWIILKEDGAK